MRILFWAEHFWPLIGGAENRLLFLIDHLVAQGHACCVITNRFPAAPLAYEERNGVPVHRLDIRDVLFKRDMRRLGEVRQQALAIKQAFRPDVEQVMCTGPSLIVQQMCQRPRACPTVATLHSDFANIFRNQGEGVLGSMLRQAAAIVVISDRMRADVLRKFPHLESQLVMIQSGLPWPALEPAPLPFSPPVLLCIGRIVHRKGFDLALQALRQLVPAYPDVRMIVGGDGPEKPALEAQARELQIEDRVTFTGWVKPDDVSALLNRATLVIVPSRNEEASSVVLRESTQMARPVLASRVGGTPELIQDGVNGLLFEKEDASAIARAAVRLLDDPDLARRLGETGRELARQRFDFQCHLDGFLSVYRRVQELSAARSVA